MADAQVVFFDRRLIALQQELCHPAHAELREKYGGERDLSDSIGHLAAECNIAMDGMYGYEDIMNLLPILVERLQGKRSNVIVIGATDV